MTDPAAAAAKLLPEDRPVPQAQQTNRAELLTRSVRSELEILYTGGIVEIAARNPNVRSYCDHWENRAETAEANTRPQPAPPSQAAFQVVATIPGYGGHGYPGPYAGSQTAPLEGEPDFKKLARDILEAHGVSGADYSENAVAGELQRMYRLGLAARPNVEDAEVEAAITYLGDEVPEEKAIADLLERLAGDFGQLQSALELANEHLKIVYVKLAEREDELAGADAAIYENMIGMKVSEDFTAACNRHAARQQQKETP